jgi:integrase
VLCTFLYTSELIAANPMPLVGRPKFAKTLPKALPGDSVAALLAALDSDPEPWRRSEWIERDRALILTGLLAWLRADETVLEHYLDSRRVRFPATAKQRSPGRGLAAWPATAPLFVGADRDRISRGTLQYRCCAHFGAPASIPTAPAAHSCTGCATPSPPNWPTPTSASTP